MNSCLRPNFKISWHLLIHSPAILHETAITFKVDLLDYVMYNLFVPKAPNKGVSILVIEGSLQKIFEEKLFV